MDKPKVAVWLPLTKSERAHLLKLVSDAERRGEYYGSKKSYEKRHKHIKNMLTGNVVWCSC